MNTQAVAANASVDPRRQESVLLQTAKAVAYNVTQSDRSAAIRLLMDGGSQRTYVTIALRDALQLPVLDQRKVIIKAFGQDNTTSQVVDVVQLGIRVPDGEDITVQAYAVPLLCDPITGQSMHTSVECCSHLDGLALADTRYDTGTRSVDLLIGVDLYWTIATGNIIRGADGPVAVEPKLGWVLSGPATVLPTPEDTSALATHVFSVEEETSDGQEIGASSMPEEFSAEMSRREMEVVDNSAALLTTTHPSSDIGLVIDCTRFSNYNRLLRVTATVLKAVQRFKSKRQESESELTAGDLDLAEKLWINHLQLALPSHQHYKSWQAEFGLFVDNGLIRCGGRLQNSDLPLTTKHPYLLPKDHHVTDLIVNECHARVMHGGVKATLMEFRARFWLVKGRQRIRQIIHSCTREETGKLVPLRFRWVQAGSAIT